MSSDTRPFRWWCFLPWSPIQSNRYRWFRALCRSTYLDDLAVMRDGNNRKPNLVFRSPEHRGAAKQSQRLHETLLFGKPIYNRLEPLLF